MMRRQPNAQWTRRLRLVALAALGLLVVILPLPALAQGCALCYTQAASAGHKMIEALRNGIVILVAPPTLGSIGMIFLLRRKSNQVRRSEIRDGCERDW